MNKIAKILLGAESVWAFGSGLFLPIFAVFSEAVGGDILAAVDDLPMLSERDLTRYLDTETEIGQTIQVELWRDGQQVTVPVTLTERPR